MKGLRTPALIVLLVLGASGRSSAQPYPGTILFETFTGGIPGSWTIVDGNSDGITWTTVDPGLYHIGAPFDRPAAVIDSDLNGFYSLDEQLISPTIDISACTGIIYVDFANVFKCYAYSQPEVADVDLSTDGGTTWTNRLRMSGNDYGPELKTLRLPDYPRDFSSVRLRFHYYNARDEFWWLVDNVHLYCICPADGTAPAATASPVGGTYSTAQSVTLACDDAGGCGCKAIHYTLDESEPTTSSPVFSGPIAIPDDTIIKFFAIDFKGNRSATITEDFAIATPIPPIANAGAAQTVHVGTEVTLDGSASSDPDGNYSLSYAWTMASAPQGSHAALSDPLVVNPSFVADKEGEYTIHLIVRDAQDLQSEPAAVTISTSNSAPTADAGQSQTVPVNTTVTLDGNASTDPDGDEIAGFAWSLNQRPDGSTAEFSDVTSPAPSVRLDVPGDYVFSLVVTDCWGRASAPSSVTISTSNTPPVAAGEAAPQFVTLVNTTVNLNADESYDPDGDAVTYSWVFKTDPSGSAVIENPTNAVAPFVATTHGDYVIELIVTDCWNASHTATLTVSFDNLPPTADPGVNQSVNTGSLVSLDGAGSSDPNGDSLTYQWSVVTRPSGSVAALVAAQSPSPTFTADVEGIYTIQLIVNDGLVSSEPHSVTVTATSVSAQVVEALTGAIEAINALDLRYFKNKNMRNTLTTKINVVIEQIRLQQYDEAADKLQNDVLAKLDGCGATPDPNDWIIQCQAQIIARPLIVEALNSLRTMRF